MPDRVRVNVANPNELLRLPGVGPEQAERIVKFRAQYGPIGNESELSRVLGWRGVGESMWGRLDFSSGDARRGEGAAASAPGFEAARERRDALPPVRTPRSGSRAGS
jgi:Helix-hairpin-helix motif